MKRLLVLFIVVLFIITLFPGKIAYAVTETVSDVEVNILTKAKEEETTYFYEDVDIEEVHSSEAFSEKISELIIENDTSEYFSQIVINQQEGTVSIDGGELTEVKEELVNGDVVNIKNDQSGIDIFSVLPEEAACSLSEALTSEGTESSENKYVSVNTLEEHGFIITSNEKDEIVISNPYQTKRLIVRTEENNKLDSTYGAAQVISDSNGRYVLQYDTVEATMKAHKQLETEKDISSVVTDNIVVISQISTENSHPLSQNGRNRWGSERIESDRYKEYLASNNKHTRITVAVIDTGVDLEHPFIKDRLVAGYDFIDNDSVPDDKNMHGTHCSGIIRDNTPENVKIMPVKVFNSDGRATDLSVALGIDYAVKNGADVLSMSFVGVCEEGNVCEQELAIKRATEAGVVCVVAAGNESGDTSNCCPAKIKSCITVSSVGEDGKLSYFSNFGKAIDVAAPGENIWSSTLNGKYEVASGTSMATPFVAAATAMLLTNNPFMTVAETEKAVKEICADQGIKGEDQSFGAGIIDFGVYFGDNDKATSISIAEKTVTVTVSKAVKFDPVPVAITLLPEKATVKTYTVKVNDESVAEYNGFGFVGKKVGSTTATFTLDNGKSQTVKIICEKRSFWIEYASDKFAGGTGTKYDPYIVKTPEQLARISYMGDKCLLESDMYFKQTADINLAGKTWYPIMGRDPEKGVARINYDGGGYEIKNMHIANIKSDVYVYYGGFFACTEGEIKNVNIIDVDINLPETYVSPICVDMGGHIENCYASGKVKGVAAGGIVCRLGTMNGSTYDTLVRNCRSDVTVIAGSAGGITWSMENGVIENCVFTGRLEGEYCWGGIASSVSPTDGCAYEPDCACGNCKIINCISVENLIGEIQYDSYVIVSGSKNQYIKTATDSKNLPKDLKFEMSNCYFSGEYREIKGEASDKVTIKNIQKVDGSLFKSALFYSEKGRWESSAPWDMKNTWKLNDSYPQVKADKTSPEVCDFDYYEFSDYITVTGYYGTESKVKIPSKISGKPVRIIDSDFHSHNTYISSISLPNTVKSISNYAFCYSLGRVNETLEHISLGQVKYIGRAAFGYCVKLKTVTVPSSVEYMDAFVFLNCEIQHAFFEGDANHISDKIFYANCSQSDTTMYYKKGTSGWKNFKADGFSKKIKIKTYDPDVPVAAIFTGEHLQSHVLYGKNNKLEMKVCPESASKAKLTYKTSNKNISINKKGIVTTKKKNNVTSTVYVYYKDKKIGAIPCLTFYPKDIKYNIEFKANGGTGKMSTQKNALYTGSVLKKNTFTAPEGKVFAGWSFYKNPSAVLTDGQEVKELTTLSGGTVTLYAVWITPETYKIIYNTNGGKLSEKAKTKYKSGTGYTLSEPTRKGYTFAGWYTDKELEKEKISVIKPWKTGTVNVYAKWKRNTYSVSFNANGGTGKMSKQTGFVYGKTKKLKENAFTAPKGKVFAGWATKRNVSPIYTNGQKVKNITSKNGKNVTLYAVWITPNTYKIKYYTNGGKLPGGTAKTYKSGTGYTLPTPTRKGYTFVGWYTNSNLKSGKIADIKPWKTGAVKVYAKWKTV